MTDTVRSILSTVLGWGIAFLFLCVAIYDVKRSTPAQLLPWLKIKAEQLTDVRAYNCENCTMWMSCGFVFFVVGLCGFINNTIQAVMYVLCIFPGGMFLIKRYKKILRSYLIEETIADKE